MIKSIYEKVTRGNTYDLAQAGEHTNSILYSGIKANQMPETERQYVEKNHVRTMLFALQHVSDLVAS